MRVLYPTLEDGRWGANLGIEVLEGRARFEPLAALVFPKGLVAENLVLRGVPSGILPELEKSDSAAVTRFTYGPGTTGVTREAYVAGWIVIGDLLQQGRHSRSSHEFDQRTCLRPCVVRQPIGLPNASLRPKKHAAI
jgi:hypothetical protein